MTAYLLDTNHASAVYKNQLVLTRHPRSAPGDTFSVCLPSVGELWFMVFNSTKISENAAAMHAILATFGIHEFDERGAEEFGRIKSELRKIGRMIPDVDIQIAAIARVRAMTLLTDDAHFAQVGGIRTQNWLR